MIHWAEKRAMSANATVLAYLGRAQSEELPHTFPILQTVRCEVMSRISKEARLPPPDSVHGVLPLSDVKACRPQQAGCCIVISQPLIQLIARLPQDRVVSSRAEADRWFLIAPCCESTPVPELQKHLSEVRMTPTKDGEGWHYVAEGNWDLLGTGPNAPVLGLARSDGCGGQI